MPFKIEKIRGQPKYKIHYNQWSEVEIPETQKPEALLKKWGNECWVKISYPDFSPINPKQSEGKLKWVNRNKEVHLYPLEPRTITENGHTFKQLEQGGFEFEVILKKKPPTNKIVLDIETKGLKFLYQPPLHPDHPTWSIDELGGYSFKSENTVGSYTIYHETQDKLFKTQGEGGKYKVGKFGHFFRPKATDSNGSWVWCDLNIDKKAGISTITVPQNFLDTAVYPVSTGTENFGYETIGTTGTYIINDYLYTYPYSATEAGTVNSITGYCKDAFGVEGVAETYIRWILYDATDLVDYTDEKVIDETVADDWYLLNGTQSGSISSGEYYMGFWLEQIATAGVYFPYDDDESDNPEYQAEDYSGTGDIPPATWSPSASTSNRKFSIYCTYTPAAAGVVKTVNGIAFASCKTWNGIAMSSVKTINGLAAQ